MKKLYFFTLFLCISFFTQAQNAPFITTWEVTGSDLDITIPTEGDGYNYTIDFGDGTIEDNVAGDISHTYNEAGIYTVSISGDFPRIYFGQYSTTGEPSKLSSIEQWGDIQWQSMESAFSRCNNLVINATDIPDLSQVSNMSSMFFGAENFNQPINNWDVSNVTDMSFMFFEANSFNQPLNNWDVSNVTGMSCMLRGASSFNQPLNNWDVSNVTGMSSMFREASSFNQSLNNWDVLNVIDMISMFQGASSFNQDLSSWDFTGIWFFSEGSSYSFVKNSGLDIYNYDKLLARFVELNIEEKLLWSGGLEYCNELVHDQLINELGWGIYEDNLAEDCESLYNLISVNLLYDENNDGCDASDLLFDNLIVNIGNENTDISLLPNDGGNYRFYVEEGSYAVTITNLPDYYTVSPETTTVYFTGLGEQEQVDFCITANQVVEDLSVTLLPVWLARPGFETVYQLVVQNMGTQTVNNAEVSLSFDNTKQSFVGASQVPTVETENSLTFTINELLPFQSQVIDLTMLTFEPPTVNGDDVLDFTASVSPDANDYTPEDNNFDFEQIVVNSFDPNDKQVLQGEEIYEDQTDEYLDYIIRFQNTGTASAVNVKVLDTLDAQLDWNSLQMVNASDDYRVEITDGNKLAFIFDNINLPYEAEDEPGSHGFIAFKIKPRPEVALGDIILGKSYIYFDFNEPIITNEVSTEVTQRMGVEAYTLADQLSVYPNPATDVLCIQVNSTLTVKQVQLYNLQGKELLSSKGKTINLENLSAGLYLVKITTNKGVVNKQVVKK